MRLFVAIQLSNDLRAKLEEMSAALKGFLTTKGRRVSWVKPENLHVTLKFLGEVPEARLPELCEALGSVTQSGSIRLSVAKLEFIPPRRPRVIAAGLNGDLDRLNDLHRAIEMQCAGVGIPLEGRRYLPHVTLARVKGTLNLGVAELERCAGSHLPTGKMTVGEFVLMESQLESAGAHYARLARFSILKTESETRDSPAAE